MATKSQAKGERRARVTPAPTPTRAPAPASTEGGQGKATEAAVQAGVDPRADAVAAAPTPNTTNSLERANEAPGVGGLSVEEANRAEQAPRRRVKAETTVKVKPTRAHFNLTDDNGVMHTYPVGTVEMPASHASHWYAEANGVELDD